MFSNIIHHIRATLPQGISDDHVGTDVGDFDHTPPPSARASVDMSRSEDRGSGDTKELKTNQFSLSYDLLKSQLSKSEVNGKDDPTPLRNSRQSEPATATTSKDILGTLPGPPYHKTSLSQNGMTTQNIRLQSSIHDRNEYEIEGVTGNTERVGADNGLESSRHEVGPWLNLEQNSITSRSISSNKD
ncbi:major facilitator superfamily transporter [Fusarium beomiforme]|uniref:Major facilitator superfamily transporter n=1 Tax=Fusarium beomiforme TaxID=44412 RepID=A0A9P5A5A8_9HYPO|nr:major facilitator superfamily transporter [Fusarium beomiforme]